MEVFGPDWGTSFMAHDREILEKRTTVTHEEIINDTTFLTTKFPIIDDDG